MIFRDIKNRIYIIIYEKERDCEISDT